jgi:hypothetical protein
VRFFPERSHTLQKVSIKLFHILCVFSRKKPYFTEGVNEIVSYFERFCPIWMKIGTEGVRRTFLNEYEFIENLCSVE